MSYIQEFLSKENFEKLQEIMYSKNVKTGNYLFWEGDESDRLYFIKSGKAKLKKSTEEGKDLILSIMNKGDLLGEFGGTSRMYHGYSAEVVEDVELGIIQLKDLEILLYQFGDFAVEFLHWVGLMNRIIQSKFRDLLLYGKSGALASTLIRLSNTYGVPCADQTKINIKLTNTEIADFIGMTRETVNRLLNAWKEEGILSIKNGYIYIERMNDLKKICKCPSYPSCPKEICRI